jgi:hypothetical protein
VDLGFEHKAFGVHQDVTLSAFDLLGSVVTTLFSAYCGTLDRLGINHTCAGLGISPQANPKAFSDSPVDPLPGAIDTPLSEIVVDGGPSRKVMRK